MLVDANILLYSVDEDRPFHERATSWLTDALNGQQRVGLPWLSLWAFLRIATNPRALEFPLTPTDAWSIIEGWIQAPAAWVPEPGVEHGSILRELVVGKDLRAGLVADAALAAVCLEHGLTMVSADSDFARFRELTWVNPITGTALDRT